MNISEKAKQHIDACRFCWMCRHICPVGNATGQERHNPRARALGLSVVYRGAESSETTVDNLYECALCGACVNDCVTGWDPVFFTTECKTDTCLDGFMPAYIETMVEKFENSGNIYGAQLNAEIEFNTQKTDTLVFFGEDTRFKVDGVIGNVTAILNKAGVKFTSLKDEPSSGNYIYFLTGKSGETLEIMKSCATILSTYKRVVVYDPSDLKLFLREYKEFGAELTCEIIGFNNYLCELVDGKKLSLKQSSSVYTPQDNFNNARELDLSDDIRQLLAKCGTVKDMFLNRKETVFAGSLIMNEYMPQAVSTMAEKRWDNVKSAGAKILVTESPCEYAMLSKTKPEGFELYSIEEVVLKHIQE